MAETATKVDVQETTVMLSDPPKAPEPEALPTLEDLKKEGFTEHELELAQKAGKVAKPGEEQPKKEEAKPAEKTESELEPKAEPEKPATKQQAGVPDFELTPEQEKVFLSTFGPGTKPRALYFRMKNERHARQSAEDRIRELEAANKALIEVKPAKEEPKADPDEENKPLTLKALKELAAKEKEAFDKQRAAQAERQKSLVAAHTEQENFMRAEHEDFDQVVEKAKEVINKLDELLPEKWQQDRAVRLIRDLQIAAAHADKLGLDENHAARIAYELGKLHPGASSAPAPKKDEPKKGGLTAEQMRKLEQSTQRRTSSASVAAGNGRRTVSVDDVGEAELNAMTYKERDAFRQKFPERYAAILRGE